MSKRDQAMRESIRREAEALKLAGWALLPLDFQERRRVLVVLCDRFQIDPIKLGSVNQR